MDDESLVLKRRYRSLPLRKTMFIDWKKSTCAFEEGPIKSFKVSNPVNLAEVLAVASTRDIEVVNFVGGWSAKSSPVTEWFAAPEGWQRISYNRSPFIASYKRDGAVVTLYGSAQWFGECDDLELIRRAYVRLQQLMRAAFGAAMQLMGTPARTGLDSIERSLPQDKAGTAYRYPLLDEEPREVLEHNIGQGRVEMFAIRPNAPATDRLYIADGVWMYSACSRYLPAPPMEHDSLSVFAEYRPAFYRVNFRVPAGWDHIGLLPVWHPRQKRTVFPFNPGSYEYSSLVSSYELRLALERGWDCRIVERWLFADEKAPGADPLENWIMKLRSLRDRASDATEGDIAPLLRAALRSIALKAIGSFHRRGRYEQRETPVSQMESLPVGAEILWQDGDIIRWRKPIALHRSMLHFQHPEWSAYVWSHARYRLAREALKFDRSLILALRSDAIVLLADPGEEFDPAKNTRPGQFRLKEVFELKGLPLPKTNREYLDIRRLNRTALDPDADEEIELEEIA